MKRKVDPYKLSGSKVKGEKSAYIVSEYMESGGMGAVYKGENLTNPLPDLPGCVSTGDTVEELKRNMQEAIELHLEGLREDGLPIPEPSEVDFIEVAA